MRCICFKGCARSSPMSTKRHSPSSQRKTRQRGVKRVSASITRERMGLDPLGSGPSAFLLCCPRCQWQRAFLLSRPLAGSVWVEEGSPAGESELATRDLPPTIGRLVSTPPTFAASDNDRGTHHDEKQTTFDSWIQAETHGSLVRRPGDVASRDGAATDARVAHDDSAHVDGKPRRRRSGGVRSPSRTHSR